MGKYTELVEQSLNEGKSPSKADVKATEKIFGDDWDVVTSDEEDLIDGVMAIQWNPFNDNSPYNAKDQLKALKKKFPKADIEQEGKDIVVDFN